MSQSQARLPTMPGAGTQLMPLSRRCLRAAPQKQLQGDSDQTHQQEQRSTQDRQAHGQM